MTLLLQMFLSRLLFWCTVCIVFIHMLIVQNKMIYGKFVSTKLTIVDNGLDVLLLAIAFLSESINYGQIVTDFLFWRNALLLLFPLVFSYCLIELVSLHVPRHFFYHAFFFPLDLFLIILSRLMQNLIKNWNIGMKCLKMMLSTYARRIISIQDFLRVVIATPLLMHMN